MLYKLQSRKKNFFRFFDGKTLLYPYYTLNITSKYFSFFNNKHLRGKSRIFLHIISVHIIVPLENEIKKIAIRMRIINTVIKINLKN